METGKMKKTGSGVPVLCWMTLESDKRIKKNVK
jgi:hypothetical protein